MRISKARTFFIAYSGIIIISSLWSCNVSPSYHEYKPTSTEGWEQRDVIQFPIDSLLRGGEYSLSVGVRATAAYPFQTLYLLVEQNFTSPVLTRRDTVKCVLTNKQGDLNGSGLRVMQYSFPVGKIALHKGQSGTITIRHIMRREILPGVSDVGIDFNATSP